MRIAVIGSSNSPNPVGDAIGDPYAIEDFCVRLGSVLAEFPHMLLVVTDLPHTADRLVVDGILTSQRGRKISVRVYYQPGRRPDRPFAEESTADGDMFVFKLLPSARVSAAHLSILRDADVAIIIGGGANSYAAGLAASLMRVRLIPVAAFGGAGRLLWQELSDQFDSPVTKLPSRRTWDNIAGTPEGYRGNPARNQDAAPAHDRAWQEQRSHAS